MKVIKELAIIMSILVLAHIVKVITHIPVPVAILGMIILLVSFIIGLLKVENVEVVSQLLLKNLTLLLIPGGVGLINSYWLVKGKLLEITIVVTLTTIIGLVTTGALIQLLKSLKKKV